MRYIGTTKGLLRLNATLEFNNNNFLQKTLLSGLIHLNLLPEHIYMYLYMYLFHNPVNNYSMLKLIKASLVTFVSISRLTKMKREVTNRRWLFNMSYESWN